LLRTHAAVVVAAMQDDPAADWVTALPPVATVADFERQLRHLGVLQELEMSRGSLDPFHVCHARSKPLFDCLTAVPTEDLSEMLRLADYLQLPKGLALAVQQHQEALSQLGVPQVPAADDPTGAARMHLYDVLNGSVILAPLLEAAVAAATSRSGYADDSGALGDSPLVRRFYRLGLCGSQLRPAHKPLVPATECREWRLYNLISPEWLRYEGALAAEAAQVAGLLIAGQPRTWHASLSDGVKRLQAPATAAACTGNLEALMWLESEGWACPPAVTAACAARHGHLHVLEALLPRLEDPGRSNFDLCEAAAAGGHLPALQLLATSGWDMTADVVSAAAGGGHAAVLRWLLEVCGVSHSDEAPYASCWAAERGDIPMLEYLRDKGWPLHETTVQTAAYGGHLRVLQWLGAQDPPLSWTAAVCSMAASRGHLHVLQWLRSQDPPCLWDGECCDAAAGGGLTRVLEWCRSVEPPCPWGTEACQLAAAGGHLDTLRWLRSQEPPCPWNGRETAAAARRGHVHIMVFLQEQGCPLDETAILWAVLGCQLEALQWLCAQTPPCPWPARPAAPSLACSADARAGLLTWLLSHSPWYPADAAC
jgi:hypothetical protein